nr:retrotransposon protein, putative, Ty1-copia subclass [Tanacetum cinerariifolium]
MKGYFDKLESINMVFDVELSINIILSGLPADYNQFVLSYQMNEKETSIMELHSLLQAAEQGIKKIDVPSTSTAHVVSVGHNGKKRKTSHSNWKGKFDRGSKRKVESEIAPTSNPKEAVYFYCNTKGHWKRSCPKYLKYLKDGKVKKGSHSGSHDKPKATKWKEAIKREIRIFKKKIDMDGKVHTYKARIMLAIAAFHDYKIWQIDVKTSFLNGKLTEDVFMAQQEGFENAKDRSKRLIGLSQDTYLDKFLKTFKMKNSNKGNLPLHHGIKISKDLCLKTDEELDKMSRVPYALAIGSIMYAMTCIRPDVSFALSMVSRHQQNPGKGHWIDVKNIHKYLRNTKDRFIVYGREEEHRKTGYCDANWQTDKDDSHLQFGWIFLLNGGAVTWKSLKQDTVGDSTCEFEYIAACEALMEAIWMKNFIGDLGVVPTVQDPDVFQKL